MLFLGIPVDLDPGGLQGSRNGLALTPFQSLSVKSEFHDFSFRCSVLPGSDVPGYRMLCKFILFSAVHIRFFPSMQFWIKSGQTFSSWPWPPQQPLPEPWLFQVHILQKDARYPRTLGTKSQNQCQSRGSNGTVDVSIFHHPVGHHGGQYPPPMAQSLKGLESARISSALDFSSGSQVFSSSMPMANTPVASP